jgi:hypothetical protein
VVSREIFECLQADTRPPVEVRSDLGAIGNMSANDVAAWHRYRNRMRPLT